MSFVSKKKKSKNISRGERVFKAIMKNVCVDCGHVLVHDFIFDGNSYGLLCPSCGWECEVDRR